MDLPTAGHGNEISGAVGGGYVRPPPPELHRPVYRHSADTEDISGDVATEGGACVNEILVAGQP